MTIETVQPQATPMSQQKQQIDNTFSRPSAATSQAAGLANNQRKGLGMKRLTLVMMLLMTVSISLCSGCSKRDAGKWIVGYVAEKALDKALEDATHPDGSRTLEANHWNTYGFTVNNAQGKTSARVQLQHVSGPPVDLIVMQRSEYDRILEGMKQSKGFQGTYSYYQSGSEMGMTGSFDSGPVAYPDGEYVVIVDNSSNFDSHPNNKDARFLLTLN